MSFVANWRVGISVALALVGVGCIGLREFHVDRDDGFDGIQQVMEAAGGVDLVYVHGMGGYSPGDPDRITDHLVGSLDLSEINETGRAVNGSIKRREFVDHTGETRLRSYTLEWSQLTSVPKLFLQAGDRPEGRLKLHEQFKQNLMNWNLADAVISIGSYGDTIDSKVQQDLEYVLTDTRDKERPIVLVSFSLGSKILLDVLDRMRRQTSKEQALEAEFSSRIRLFFMLANQIPLLRLGELQGDSTLTMQALEEKTVEMRYELDRSLLEFIQARGNRKRSQQLQPADTGRAPWIIALSDPNDLLSYPIPRDLAQAYPNTFVNVSLSVSRRGYVIPFVGTFTDPFKAHTDYGSNKRMLELLLHGWQLTALPK